MTKLRISPDLSLPEEAVTRSFGILGMRGSGKSNAAVVLAEEMHRARLHWVAIDPKGDWWGIRASADEKGPGLPVVIFGGEHADVPLEPTAKAGVLVADLILNEGITCVLDLSEFSKNHKIQFLAGVGAQEGFAGHLFRKKKRDQDPIHVFLEEAHDYVPQRATSELGKLVDVISNLQTMGRTRGLGCSILSQRSARVHKDVLTQVDTLVTFRTIAPQDRDAVEAWVKHHGLSQELVASLPELAAGEAWIWSPEWLGKLERIRFRRRETYDSGATPVVGAKKRRSPATLADVDLGAISKAMADTIERAKAEDPKELQRKIAELQKQLRARPADVQVQEVVKEVPVEVPILPWSEKEFGVLLQEAKEIQHIGEELVGRGRGLLDVLEKGKFPVGAKQGLAGAHSGRPDPTRRPAKARPPERPVPPTTSGRDRPGIGSRPLPNPDGEVRISKPQQKLLDALAWFEAIDVQPRRAPLAAVAKTSSKSSGFEKNISTLRTAGLIDYPQPGRVCLTNAGQAIADVPPHRPTSAELQEAICAMVSGPQADLLQVLIDVYPEAVTREELADRAGVSVLSSGYEKNVSTLRSFELIDYPSRGYVAALPVLFLEESAVA